MVTVNDIVAAIEGQAPRSLQESWDNTGLQVGHRDARITGVLTCLDVTPARIDEAAGCGANMIVSHHPLIFKGLKTLTGDSQVQRTVEEAIRKGIAVYSSHTALDNASGGVSALMAQRLGARVLGPLVSTSVDSTTGTGVVAELAHAVTAAEFVAMAKAAFHAEVARCSDPGSCPGDIRRVALCGGAGGSFIADAVAAGADAYVTGDVRYHDFIDYALEILIVDCGHFETEELTKEFFSRVIKAAYPDITVTISQLENNPVSYI